MGRSFALGQPYALDYTLQPEHELQLLMQVLNGVADFHRHRLALALVLRAEVEHLGRSHVIWLCRRGGCGRG